MYNRYILILLILLAIFTRLPFMSQRLYYVDSVGYALGMEKIDFSKSAPAAPGCIGYIYFGKVLYYFMQDANRSLVFVAVLFTALGCSTLYLLGKTMFGMVNGIIAALLLLTSPLVWFFGEIALPVISNLFFSTLIALFCYRVIVTSRLSPVIFSSISLGIGASFRQDILVFMAPLFFFSICRRPLWQIFLAVLIVIVISLIWFVPSCILAGGIIPYITLCKERIFGEAGHISYMTVTNIFVKKMHLRNYLMTLLTAIFLGILPFIWYLGRFFNPLTISRDRNIQFITIWILPSFIYMNLVGGNRGYSFVHLSAIFIYLGLALESIYRDFRDAGFIRFGKAVFFTTIVSIIVVNIFFFFHDPHPGKKWMGSTWFRNIDIRRHDEMLEVKLRYIEENFSPQDSIIFAGGSKQTYWSLLYYLPEYRVCQPSRVFWQVDTMEFARYHRRKIVKGEYVDISEVKDVIFFDEDIYSYIKTSGTVKKIVLDKGYAIYLLHVTGERYIKLGHRNIEILVNTQ